MRRSPTGKRQLVPAHATSPLTLSTLVARVCRPVGVRPVQLGEGSRRAVASRAQDGIAHLWVEVPGHPGRPLAPLLGVHPQAVYQAVPRCLEVSAEWVPLLRS